MVLGTSWGKQGWKPLANEVLWCMQQIKDNQENKNKYQLTVEFLVMILIIKKKKTDSHGNSMDSLV